MVMYLVDTNILLRVLHRTDPRHAIVRGTARTLRTNGHALQATHKILQSFGMPVHVQSAGMVSD